MSKRFAIVLITLLLSCLIIFPIANTSVQACGGTWDITDTSGIKTDYQLEETISGSISFKINNQSGKPMVTQQILVGLVDSQNRVIDIKCIYDGRPEVCPEWTTGTVSVSWESPSVPGTYRILATQDANYSCRDAKLNFRPKESYRHLATITVSASEPVEEPVVPITPPLPTPTKEDTTTGLSGSGTPQGGGASQPGVRPQVIIVVVALLVLISLVVIAIVWIKKNRILDLMIENLVMRGANDGGAMTLEGFKEWVNYMHWRQFENYNKLLLKRLGFTGMVTKPTKDGGIDVRGKRMDELGINSKYIIQCKRYVYGRVGVEVVSQLNGILHTDVPPSKGIVACTGGFTKDAVDFAKQSGIILWDVDFLYELHKKSLSNRN